MFLLMEKQVSGQDNRLKIWDIKSGIYKNTL